MRNVEWPWWRLRRCRSQRPSLCPVDGVPDGRGASVAALLQIEVDIDTLDRADLDAVVDAAEAVGVPPCIVVDDVVSHRHPTSRPECGGPFRLDIVKRAIERLPQRGGITTERGVRRWAQCSTGSLKTVVVKGVLAGQAVWRRIMTKS
jgi:hypothetical protein